MDRRVGGSWANKSGAFADLMAEVRGVGAFCVHRLACTSSADQWTDQQGRHCREDVYALGASFAEVILGEQAYIDMFAELEDPLQWDEEMRREKCGRGSSLPLHPPHSPGRCSTQLPA